MADRPPAPGTASLAPVKLGLKRRLFDDVYHKLLTLSWPKLLAALGIGYVTLNMTFALLYLAGGDCLENVRRGNFLQVLFFSIQTMSTVGGGKVTPKTDFANFLVTVEAGTGVLLFPIATALFFAKFSRPTARVLFSKVAVVYPDDGVPSLMFRMTNERQNRIVEVQLRAMLIRRETAADGEVFRRLHDLNLTRSMNPVFSLTWTAVHPIDESSPLKDQTLESLCDSQAFIIASLVGIDETFAATVHDRHVYSSDDIIFGARLADVMVPQPDGSLAVDYSKFHDVVRPGGERA